MNIIELDFLSIVVGYTVGVAMMWSITQTVFHTEVNDDEEKTKEGDANFRGGFYHGNYPYNLPTSN